MSRYERVTVRLTPEEVASMRRLVDSGEYSNICEVASQAIASFLSDKEIKGRDVKEMSIEDPTKDEPLDLDSKIREAVRDYLSRKMQ